MAGAPEGNKNSSKNNRLWAETIKRAVAQSDPERLRRIAESLLNKAEEGDLGAIKELGDRLDGKAMQAVEQTTEVTGSLTHSHVAVPNLSVAEWMEAHGLGTPTRPTE